MDVGANSAYFNLEFYGSSPYRFSTFEDMAIDNIQLLYCDPHKTYPTPPPSAGSINCTSTTDSRFSDTNQKCLLLYARFFRGWPLRLVGDRAPAAAQ